MRFRRPGARATTSCAVDGNVVAAASRRQTDNTSSTRGVAMEISGTVELAVSVAICAAAAMLLMVTMMMV